MTCMAYLEEIRVTRAMQILQYEDLTISEVGNICGYTDQNYFSKVFKKHSGMTPSDYQKQMRGLC
jgi:two-component system response regulator YesN